MRVTIIALALIGAMAGPEVNLLDPVITQEDVDYINSVQSDWIASMNWVEGKTWEDARNLATTTIVPSEFPEKNWGALLDYVSVPSSFDSRDEWPGCINSIRDQGQCGSCWAFGAAESLSDRFCIDSNGSEKVVLSPQYLVDCDYNSYGCNGGYPDLAWRYMANHGIPLDSCVPYKASDQSCPSKCADGSSLHLYKAKNVHSYSSASSIQTAMMQGGPCEAAFTVYQDFMSYSGGIYTHTWGSVLGGHAVKFVGWGTSSAGKNYWIVANSWGTSWGISGYFWIEFGQCGIDSSVVCGDASY